MKFYFLTASCLLTMLVTADISPAESVEFTLVEHGRPKATIVVSATNEWLDAAVADFQAYVYKITGATVPILQGPAFVEGPVLNIGLREGLAPVKTALSFVQYDGFAIIPTESGLVIAGQHPEGAANGLYTLLQDQFGVRWYYEGELWEVVPETDTLRVTVELDNESPFQVCNPGFIGRFILIGQPSTTIQRRMRLNNPALPKPFARSGHTLQNVVPQELFEERPDLFSYWEGAYRDDNPNFAHPEMPELVMEYIRNQVAAGRQFVGLGVNDSVVSDQSELSLALDTGTPKYYNMWNASESYYTLIKEVAAQTSQEFPEVRLGFYAYQQVTYPPTSIDYLGDNLDVWLCTDTSQHYNPAMRQLDRWLASEWSSKVGGLCFFAYPGLDNWTPRYFPSLVSDHIKHLSECGFQTYAPINSVIPGANMPMHYMIYQLMWKPEIDEKILIETMLKDLYEEVYEQVADYYAHWEHLWMQPRTPVWLDGCDSIRKEFRLYSLQDITKGYGILSQAYTDAQAPKVRARLQFLLDECRFILALARVHSLYEYNISAVPSSQQEAMLLSDSVAQAWQNFQSELDRYEQVAYTPLSLPQNFTAHLRYWEIYNEARDAVVAPLVRWSVANENKFTSEQNYANEDILAKTALANLDVIYATRESFHIAEDIPHIAGLLVAPIPYRQDSAKSEVNWEQAPVVTNNRWVYRFQDPEYQRARLEEHSKFLINSPDPDVHSAHWQATWDYLGLHLRVTVTDQKHIMNLHPWEMWQQDSLQLAFSTNRQDGFGNFWGRYGPNDLEFGLSMDEQNEPVLYFWTLPFGMTQSKAHDGVQALVTRTGNITEYTLTLRWWMFPEFVVQPLNSLGVSLVVNEFNGQRRISAEYGQGVVTRKRPCDFAAIRLAP